MKTFYLFLTCSFITAIAFTRDPSPEVVGEIDLDRYSGTWFEIARLPNRFQEQCAGDVTATYTLLENGRIKVVNRCRTETGDFTKAEGQARPAGENKPNSKLKVRFAPRILSFLPFVWGDYWIIDLDPEYRYAVVGDPARKYLWILAREPEMDEGTLEGIIKRAGDQGYDLSDLVMTRHRSG